MVLRFLLIFMYSHAQEYRFLHNFGEVFFDYSGNGLHGVNGVNSFTTTGNLQVSDRGIFLNGEAGCVQLPPNDIVKDSPSLGSSFLMQMWILPLDISPGIIFFRSQPFFSELIISQSSEKEGLEVILRDFQLSKIETIPSYFSICKLYLAEWFYLSISCSSGKMTILKNRKVLKSFEMNYFETSIRTSFIGHSSLHSAKALIALFSLSDLFSYNVLISESESSRCFSKVEPCESSCFPSILIGNSSGCLPSGFEKDLKINSEYSEILKFLKCESCSSCESGMNFEMFSCIDFDRKSKEINGQLIGFSCDRSCLLCELGNCICPENSVFIGNSCTCFEGFFISFHDNKTAFCMPCLKYCSVCTQRLSCLSCKEGYFLGNFGDSCIPCHDHCKSCIDSSKCLICKAENAEPTFPAGCKCKTSFTPMNLHLNTSESCSKQKFESNPKNSSQRKLEDCKDGYYEGHDNGSKCKKCPEKCNTCESADECLSCSPGKFLSKKKCEDCPKRCYECTSDGSCTSCGENSKLNSGKCECEDSYFLSDDSCEQCSEKCKTCSKKDYCIICEDGSTAENGICGCQEGFYKKDSKCIKCETGCKECEESECTNCFETLNLADGSCNCPQNSSKSGEKCVCSDGFYMKTISDNPYSCEKCEDPCEYCKNEIFCTKCIHSYHTLNTNDGTCTLQCDEGEFPNVTTCEKCQDLCEICENSVSCSNCTEHAEWNNEKETCECKKSKNVDGKCVKEVFKFELSKDGKRIFLTFNESLEEDLSRNNFSLYIAGKGEPDFDFSAKSTKKYIFSLHFKSSISKNTELKIKITQNPLESAQGSTLLKYSASITLDEFLLNVTSPAVKAVINKAKAMASSSVFTTLGISLMSNPASAWILVNTLQLISYLPISSNFMTTNIKNFCTALAGFNILPNPISYMFDEDASDPPNDDLQSAGIETSVFWVNAGQNASVLILMIILCPFIVMLSKVPLTEMSLKLQRILKNYRYGLFLRYWIQAYLDLAIFALVQMMASINIPGQGYFNLGSATVVMIIVVLTSPFLFVCSYVSFSRIKDQRDEEYKIKYGSLFYEFKNDKGLISTQFYTIFFVRRLSYVLAHFYLDQWHFVKMGINLAFTVFTLGFIVYFRPHKEKTVIISCFIGEIAVFNAMMVNLLLAIPGVNENAEVLDGFFILGTFLCMILQTLISIFEFFVVVFEIYKKLEKERAMKFVGAHSTLSIK